MVTGLNRRLRQSAIKRANDSSMGRKAHSSFKRNARIAANGSIPVFANSLLASIIADASANSAAATFMSGYEGDVLVLTHPEWGSRPTVTNPNELENAISNTTSESCCFAASPERPAAKIMNRLVHEGYTEPARVKRQRCEPRVLQFL